MSLLVSSHNNILVSCRIRKISIIGNKKLSFYVNREPSEILTYFNYIVILYIDRLISTIETYYIDYDRSMINRLDSFVEIGTMKIVLLKNLLIIYRKKNNCKVLNIMKSKYTDELSNLISVFLSIKKFTIKNTKIHSKNLNIKKDFNAKYRYVLLCHESNSSLMIINGKIFSEFIKCEINLNEYDIISYCNHGLMLSKDKTIKFIGKNSSNRFTIGPMVKEITSLRSIEFEHKIDYIELNTDWSVVISNGNIYVSGESFFLLNNPYFTEINM